MTVDGTDGRTSSFNSPITTVTFDVSFKDLTPLSLGTWFRHFKNLKTINNLKYLNTSYVTNIDRIFSDCHSLTSLDLSTFNLARAVESRDTFSRMYGLKNLNLSGLDLTNCTQIQALCYQCENLETCNMTGLRTYGTTMFKNNFFQCGKLKSLDLSGVDFSRVGEMMNCFAGCSSLQTIIVSDGVDVSKHTPSGDGFGNMFGGCTSLVGKRYAASGVIKSKAFDSNAIDQTYAKACGTTDATVGYFTPANRFNAFTINYHYNVPSEPDLTESIDTTIKAVTGTYSYTSKSLWGRIGYTAHDWNTKPDGKGTAFGAVSQFTATTEPKAGESPVFTAESADPTMYSVGYVDYTRVRNGSETHLGSDYVFAEGYEYRVYVEFEPTEEYTFGDDAKFFINGVLAKKYYSKSFRIFYVGDHEHKLTHYDAVEPTCSWEGVVEHYECSVCMKNYEDEACTKEITGSVYIPKTAHTPAEPVKENETPFTYDSVIYCTVCGEEISREWIATSGPSHTHTPGEEHKENEIAATCAKEGEYDLIIRCKECDDIMAITHIETDKLPHTPGEVKKENDTGDEWDEVMYCTECGEELSRTHVKDGTPVVTGIYGDVDCDGTITANDALMILRQSVGMEHFDSELIFISDVDGDGEVTANDALAVLRNSVGMNDDNLVGKPVN